MLKWQESDRPRHKVGYLEVSTHLNDWSEDGADKDAHYFIFFTQTSQYFSIREAPSTLNKAS
jgi:hypothetical protein